MVIYQSSDGEPGFRQFEEIAEAATFVEELRNSAGVDMARIFRLEEVHFEFRQYYQVRVVDGDSPAPAAPVASAPDTSASAPEPKAAEPEAPVEAPAAAVAPPVEAPAPAKAEEPSVPIAAGPVSTESSAEDAPAASSAPEKSAADEAPSSPFHTAGSPGESNVESITQPNGDGPMATRRGLFGR